MRPSAKCGGHSSLGRVFRFSLEFPSDFAALLLVNLQIGMRKQTWVQALLMSRRVKRANFGYEEGAGRQSNLFCLSPPPQQVCDNHRLINFKQTFREWVGPWRRLPCWGAVPNIHPRRAERSVCRGGQYFWGRWYFDKESIGSVCFSTCENLMCFLASFLQNHGPKAAGLLIEANQCFVSRLTWVSRAFGRDLEEESEANDAEMDEPLSFVSWLAGGLALSWFFQFEHRPSFMHSNGVPGELLRILPLRGKVRNQVIFVWKNNNFISGCALCFQATNW